MSGKLLFLKYDYLAQSATAALQRSTTYKKDVPEQHRLNFRKTVHKQLDEIVSRFYSAGRVVDDNAHVDNICSLSELLSRTHGRILEQDRFRVGPSQKALNLHLKYLWCQGEVATPPHCPIDYNVIAELSAVHRRCIWTKLDDIQQYKAIIADAKAKANAQGMSLAEWELELWNKKYVKG
jgi:hypothetical protein